MSLSVISLPVMMNRLVFPGDKIPSCSSLCTLRLPLRISWLIPLAQFCQRCSVERAARQQPCEKERIESDYIFSHGLLACLILCCIDEEDHLSIKVCMPCCITCRVLHTASRTASHAACCIPACYQFVLHVASRVVPSHQKMVQCYHTTAQAHVFLQVPLA